MTTDQRDAPRQPAGETLHLVPEPVWEAQRQAATYTPEAFEREGFIHCTDGEANLLGVANTFYRDDPRPYVVLVLDLEQLRSPVRYDDPAQIYPHIHGPINREAVVAVRRTVRLVDGSFSEIV
ncbi:MAG: DUF952 domain-containing protein [Chloroflexota bacterium]|nr:DUF952 domain-containing protein [Chloroflexota bacterium]